MAFSLCSSQGAWWFKSRSNLHWKQRDPTPVRTAGASCHMRTCSLQLVYDIHPESSQMRRHQQMVPHNRYCIISWGLLRTTHQQKPQQKQLPLHSALSVKHPWKSGANSFQNQLFQKYQSKTLLLRKLMTGKVYKQQSSFTRNSSEKMTNVPVLLK